MKRKPEDQWWKKERTMPTKKVVTTTFDVDTPPQEELPIDEQGFDDADGVAAFLQQFSGDAFRVKVYKITAKGPEYCFAGSENVDEEMIQQFGGGEYELRVFVKGRRPDTIRLRIAERPNALQNQSSSSSVSENIKPTSQRSDDRFIDLLPQLALANVKPTTPV